MKYKSAVTYQLIDMKKPVFIFYVILLCILIFGFIVPRGNMVSINGSSGNGSSGFSGIEFATVIFLFVCGLNSFKELFRLFMQNGISRKTIFVSRIATMLAVCTGMAVIDKIVLVLGKFISGINLRIIYKGLFEMIYAKQVNQISSLQMHFEGFFFNLCLYLAAMSIGYFITIGFYRMNKTAKIVVAISVPMVLFSGIPFLDAALLNGVMMNALHNASSFAFGFQNGGNPYFGIVTLLLISTVFCIFSWLMVQRAVIKD